jgi:putative ABC transport system substrate-binding protein
MKRREFITLLGGAAAAWPLAARAQQQSLPVVGFLDIQSAKGFERYVGAFRQGLRETGFVEGQNIVIDDRWADGHPERLPALAAELVRRHVAVIATGINAAAQAAKAATATIPIVFEVGGDPVVADPVASGIVPRLDRPSGNITGFASYETTLGGKWLELLSEIAPGLKRAAIMFNPDTAAPLSSFMLSLEMVARSLKVEPIIAPVSSDVEIETAIIALGREPGGGLVVMPGVFMDVHRASIISAAARNNVPAVYNLSVLARED